MKFGWSGPDRPYRVIYMTTFFQRKAQENGGEWGGRAAKRARTHARDGDSSAPQLGAVDLQYD